MRTRQDGRHSVGAPGLRRRRRRIGEPEVEVVAAAAPRSGVAGRRHSRPVEQLHGETRGMHDACLQVADPRVRRDQTDPHRDDRPSFGRRWHDDGARERAAVRNRATCDAPLVGARDRQEEEPRETCSTRPRRDGALHEARSDECSHPCSCSCSCSCSCQCSCPCSCPCVLRTRRTRCAVDAHRAVSAFIEVLRCGSSVWSGCDMPSTWHQPSFKPMLIAPGMWPAECSVVPSSGSLRNGSVTRWQ